MTKSYDTGYFRITVIYGLTFLVGLSSVISQEIRSAYFEVETPSVIPTTITAGVYVDSVIECATDCVNEHDCIMAEYAETTDGLLCRLWNDYNGDTKGYRAVHQERIALTRTTSTPTTTSSSLYARNAYDDDEFADPTVK